MIVVKIAIAAIRVEAVFLKIASDQMTYSAVIRVPGLINIINKHTLKNDMKIAYYSYDNVNNPKCGGGESVMRNKKSPETCVPYYLTDLRKGIRRHRDTPSEA